MLFKKSLKEENNKLRFEEFNQATQSLIAMSRDLDIDKTELKYVKALLLKSIKMELQNNLKKKENK